MQQREPRKEWGLSEQVNLLYGVGQCLATVPMLFLRKPGTMGERAINHQTAIGVFLALFLVGYTDPVRGLALFHASLALCIVHGASGRRRPACTHSLYDGYPWLCTFFPLSEERAKAVWELMILLVLSVASLPFSPALGAYLFLAAFGMGLHHDLIERRLAAQVRAMRDARIEAEFVRDLYERGDR